MTDHSDGIESSKLRLEEAKFQHTVANDEKRNRSDRQTKLWSPLLTLIPILAIIVGYHFNSRLEQQKSFLTQSTALVTLKRQFVDRQLADFYYPIQLRLEKDTAVWTLSNQLSKGEQDGPDQEFSRTIENGVILPNHEEIIGIISANFALLKNGDENFDPTSLIHSINQYQRHVAAYRTLRKLHIYDKNPRQVCASCEFPDDLPKIIAKRIVELEKQRASLSRDLQRL